MLKAEHRRRVAEVHASLSRTHSQRGGEQVYVPRFVIGRMDGRDDVMRSREGWFLRQQLRAIERFGADGERAQVGGTDVCFGCGLRAAKQMQGAQRGRVVGQIEFCAQRAQTGKAVAGEGGSGAGVALVTP